MKTLVGRNIDKLWLEYHRSFVEYYKLSQNVIPHSKNILDYSQSVYYKMIFNYATRFVINMQG